MSLASLLTQTATVTPRVEDITEDEYGNEVLVAGTSADYSCRLENAASSEVLDAQDRVATEFTLFLPSTAAIGPLDAVQVDGVGYEVVGRPKVQRSPGGAHHIEAMLRRLEGA